MVDKEKQIEEMIEHVRQVTDDCQNCNLYKERLCDYNCDICETIKLSCEALHKAGYRKSEDVAREIFEEIAHMGGCSRGIFLNPWDIAELKKKYIQSEDTE